MRKNYDVPASYRGSRFIRATHGVRALTDEQIAAGAVPAAPIPPERRAPGGAPMPDFEYYPSTPPSGSGRGDTSGEPIRGEPRDPASGATRYPPDEAYRGDPSPVDRIGHDFDGDAPGGGRADAPRERRYRPGRAHGALRSPRPIPPRPDAPPHKPIAPPPHKPGDPPPPGAAHGSLPISPEEGDLLLIMLIALLSGEDGCADVAATLALLLMVR